jgi:hypothetical protein
VADTERSDPDGRLQHPGSGVHPADPMDDLTPRTGSDAVGLPVEDGPDGNLELLDDAAGLTDAERGDGPVDAEAGSDDAVPGDGTVGEPLEHGDVDAVRTVVHGRETAAAKADLSDDIPTPRETPAG